MKLIITSILAICAYAGYSYYPSPPKFSDYYYEKKLSFEKHDSLVDIVFIGNSLTEAGEWSELFPDNSIANHGINGDISLGVLYRLETVIKVKPQKVFLLIGINDLSRNIDVKTIYENINSISTHLANHKIKVFIQSVIHTNTAHASRNPSITKLNSFIKSVAQKNQLIEYIDLNKALSINSQLNPLFTTDGLHLNTAGYAAWSKTIEQYVKMR